ncbi:MAG: TonB-dependent receptor, partial [Burkholderiales bacterium]|nr:TonB-dependent receptor [Burkholderiales bacterium]
ILFHTFAKAQDRQIQFDIPAQSLESALKVFQTQSGAQVLYAPEAVVGKNGATVSGEMTASEAARQLLQGSGLEAEVDGGGRLTIRAAQSGAAPEQELPEVKVVSEVEVQARYQSSPHELPPEYAGGQVARGGRLGILGNVDVMDAPFNITSYTAQRIQDAQAQSLDAILADDPSVRALSSGYVGQQFSIRGLGPNGGASFNAVSFQGMFGVAPDYRTPMELVERVEIIKGPTAFLNGFSPFTINGGVINLVPKRATDEPVNQVGLSFSPDAHWGTRADVGRRFGEDKRWGIRVNGSLEDGEASIEQNDRLRLGGMALDYRGERLRASLDLMDQDVAQRGLIAYPTFLPGIVIPRAPDASIGGIFLPGAGSQHVRDKAAVLSAEYDIADRLTAFVNVSHHNSDLDFRPANAANVDALGNFTARASAKTLNDTTTTNINGGLRAKFTTGTIGHQVLLSYGRLRQTTDIEQYTNNSGANPPFASNIYDPVTVPPFANAGAVLFRGIYREIVSSGLAIADTVSMFDERLLVSVGARRQSIAQDQVNTLNGQAQPGYDESATTPMVGVVFKILPNLSIYGNYIEGLTKGDVVTDTTAPNFGEIFAPYITKQHETGLKWDLGSVTTTLSAFQIAQPSLGRDPATGIYSINGKQRNRGLEWAWFGELHTGLRVLGGAAYTEGKVVQSPGGIFDGKDAIGVPRWQANAGAEWDIGAMPGLSLNARVIYTGSQFIDSANAQSIPSWTRVDVGARYKVRLSSSRAVTVRALVTNLFDRDYWASATSGGLVQQGRPRTFYLSGTLDF